MSYKSPITIMQVAKQVGTELAEQFDGMIFKAVHEVVPVVDKEELLRALHYDRDQYDKGFSDGKAAAMDELVVCEDCRYYDYRTNVGKGKSRRHNSGTKCCCRSALICTKPHDFCSYGERRSE